MFGYLLSYIHDLSTGNLIIAINNNLVARMDSVKDHRHVVVKNTGLDVGFQSHKILTWTLLLEN